MIYSREPTPSAGHTGAYEEVDLVPNSSPSGKYVPLEEMTVYS